MLVWERLRMEDMEPVVGFEPTTDGLQNRCSTTELNWLRVARLDCRKLDEHDTPAQRPDSRLPFPSDKEFSDDSMNSEG